MANIKDLNGKKLAVIAMGNNRKGKEEAAVFSGIGLWNNGHLYLDRGKNKKPFQVPDEVLDRIKPVPDKIRDIVLDAEYYIPMSIGPLPDDANPKDYVKTVLKWPK
jgi:hypothetical protein